MQPCTVHLKCLVALSVMYRVSAHSCLLYAASIPTKTHPLPSSSGVVFGRINNHDCYKKFAVSGPER